MTDTNAAVISFRLSRKNPRERKALEFLERQREAGVSFRDAIAGALAMASDNDYQAARVAAQQEQLLAEFADLIKKIQAGGFVAAATPGAGDASSGQGATIDPAMIANLAKMVPQITRASDISEE